MDCANQRGNESPWPDLRALYPCAEESQCVAGPQGAVRHGHQGRRRIRAIGRARQTTAYSRDRITRNLPNASWRRVERRSTRVVLRLRMVDQLRKIDVEGNDRNADLPTLQH